MIEFDGAPPLEAHVGIKLVGKSLVSHEADVAALNAETAINCRQNSKSPASAKALMAIECKHYTSHLQLHLARSFIGLVQDLSAKEPFFVSNTNSNSVERLLSKRVNNWERDISPTSSNGEVDRLFGVFRNVFKNYVAQNR